MTHPPRFAIARAAIDGDCARLTGSELHHLRDVVRLRPGAAVALLDEDRHEYLGAILELNDDAALIAIEAVASATPARRIILAAALIKAPRMDFLVEKAAELGASELIPLQCARSIAQASEVRISRWRRVALAAAKQSHAPLMEIHPALPVSAMLAMLAPHTARIICTADGAPLTLLLSSTRETLHTLPDVIPSEANPLAQRGRRAERAPEAAESAQRGPDQESAICVDKSLAAPKACPEPAEGDPRGATPSDAPAQNLSDNPDLLIAIGPEGDFTDAERAAMLAAGFVPASLGPYRLRSETAALAALSLAAASS